MTGDCLEKLLVENVLPVAKLMERYRKFGSSAWSLLKFISCKYIKNSLASKPYDYFNFFMFHCSDTLSDLSTLPLPIMESHMESRSVPGLVVSDIWKIQEETKHGVLLQTKSEGSNVNGTDRSHRNMYQTLALSALESRGSLYPQTSSGDIHDSTPFGSGLGTQSEIGSRSGSEYDGTSLSRNESQSEKSVVPRMRSISDIVRETGEAEEDERQIRTDLDTPSILDTLSLQESGRFHNPSTSSQPESIDSVSVNITMNKDTASTVAQSGSIGEPDGSGRESSDLLTLAHRSSSLARRRRPSLQRRRRAETGAIRRRRRHDSGALADVLLQGVDSGQSTHMALSHDDTSPGAQHCYQDEFGKSSSHLKL